MCVCVHICACLCAYICTCIHVSEENMRYHIWVLSLCLNLSLSLAGNLLSLSESPRDLHVSSSSTRIISIHWHAMLFFFKYGLCTKHKLSVLSWAICPALSNSSNSLFFQSFSLSLEAHFRIVIIFSLPPNCSFFCWILAGKLLTVLWEMLFGAGRNIKQKTWNNFSCMCR